MDLNPVQFSEWQHGTSGENADSIRARGLIPNHFSREHMTVTKDPTTSKRYAMFGEKPPSVEDGAYDPGRKGAVVTFRVPRDEEHDYVHESGPGGSSASLGRGLKQALPASYIHSVEEV